MKHLRVLTLLLALHAGLAVALSAPPPGSAFSPFPEEGSGSLQRDLEQVLDELKLSAAVRRGRLAVALAELDGTRAVELAMVNGNEMIYAASLPKIAILYGAAVSLDQGRFELDDALRRDMIDMIRRSCNDCATRVLAKVGRRWLIDLLQADPWRFYDPQHGGGLWVGKDYARSRAYRRDPVHGLSHGATAWQVARWYYLLINGQLASEENTALMLEALSNPALNHKLVKGLKTRDTEEIYRKSGTWKDFHSDSVMVVAGGTRYILVVLARDQRGARWLEELAPRLHDLAVSHTPRVVAGD